MLTNLSNSEDALGDERVSWCLCLPTTESKEYIVLSCPQGCRHGLCSAAPISLLPRPPSLLTAAPLPVNRVRVNTTHN